jgi:Mn-dependent DtxR family transcriptional regulator
MNVSYLIDSIVQHTTVLIAQVATTAGVRAPLAHVANRVFLDLVTEIERQGVARKVVADMFGLALRSYQQKVQRLSESATDPGRTLWEAVYDFLKDSEVVTRTEIVARFPSDDDGSVGSILNDLVETGLVYKTGRGHSSVYRLTSEEDLGRASLGRSRKALQAALWFRVYRTGPVSREALAEALRIEPGTVEDALEELVADGRVARDLAGASVTYRSRQCLLPMDDTEGWEAALVDHFQMVTAAICTKLRNGNTRALPAEELGGSSYSFDVWPGHPAEARVRALLASTRGQISALWDEVVTYNRAHDRERRDATRVSFYFGQSLTPATREGEDT